MEMTRKYAIDTFKLATVSIILSVLFVGLGVIISNHSVPSAYAYSPMYIATFTPNPDPLMPVFNKFLTADDTAMNFRTSVVNAYPIENRLLLAQSFTAINQQIAAANSNPKSIEYIGYDNEPNNGALSTPYSETVDPAASTNKAADMVHSAGYKFGATPTRSMLLKEYQGVQWTKVDMLVMQLQKITTQPSKFTSIVNQVTSYVRGHSSNTLIYIQVNPVYASASQIASDINGVRGSIDGVSIVCETSQGCTAAMLQSLLVALNVPTVQSSPTISPTSPQAPTGLTATTSSSSQINLSWTTPANDGGSPITGYKIERSTDGGSTWSTTVSNTGSTSTTGSDTGLTSSTAYTYRVSAINSVGTSSPSNTSTATTSATSPAPTTKHLRTIMFAPNLTKDQQTMLKNNFQASDGMITSYDPVITNMQDNTGLQGLIHYNLAPRIGPISSSCSLGPVPSVQDFANQANALKPKYNIDALLYDIEGWCWTPTTEKNDFVGSVDKEAQIAHDNGFRSGMQPTHDLLLKNYKLVHFSNVDFLLIQYQKYLTTSKSGYTQIDPNYYTQVQDIINTAKAQNPNITIFLQYNLYWASVSNIETAMDHFRSQVDGISIVNLSPTDPDVTSGVPFINNNTVQNQQALIQHAHG